MGIGLESTLANFTEGGTGYITVHFKRLFVPPSAPYKDNQEWHGFETNETTKVYCYYHTAKNYGSEFLDTPKTIGIVVYCPITMDAEIGEYAFRNTLPPGYFCRSISEHASEVEIVLRSSIFRVPSDGIITHDLDGNFERVEEVKSTFTTAAAAARSLYIKELHAQHELPRMHGICTVQTFRNSQTGPMLYLFASYHLQLGFRVIIYDRSVYTKCFSWAFMGMKTEQHFYFQKYNCSLILRYCAGLVFIENS